MEGKAVPVEVRPHILAIPYPLMGHITPIVQLCNMLIARAGCRVTIACEEKAIAGLSRLLEKSNVTVLPISDGLPPEGSASGHVGWDAIRQELHALHEVLPRSFAQHIERFRSDGQVVCVISDLYLSWTQDVADQLGVPRLAVWVSAPAEFQVYNHAKDLVEAGKLPFKAPLGRGENDVDNMVPGCGGRLPIYHRINGVSLEEEKITIDGLPILNRRDFPTFLQIEDSSDVLFSNFMKHVQIGRQASMVLFNTFEALDGTLLDTLRLQGVHAHAIGPLFMLEEAVMKKHVPPMGNVNASLVKAREVTECLAWLDGQRPKSVVYVAFGTGIQLSLAQVKELAIGLLNSGNPFIWVCPKPIGEDAGTKQEFIRVFLEQCQGNGLVLDWAPQKRILNHPSTGAFLTHCGWNSTMETICYGVPALCLPFVSDQLLHCKLIVEVWKVGLRLERNGDDGLALANDISQSTQELLAFETNKQLQKRAQELKEAAKHSIEPGGSSHSTLGMMMKFVKLPHSI